MRVCRSATNVMQTKTSLKTKDLMTAQCKIRLNCHSLKVRLQWYEIVLAFLHEHIKIFFFLLVKQRDFYSTKGPNPTAYPQWEVCLTKKCNVRHSQRIKTIQRIGVHALCKGNSLNPWKHPNDFYLNECDIAKKETLSSWEIFISQGT